MADVSGESGMEAINVRQLDDEVVHRLERRAAASHGSPEGEVRTCLARAVEDDMLSKRASFLALSVRLRRETEENAQTPSEVFVRDDREQGHRVNR